MFGADVESDWQEGSDIRWKGEMKGKKYEDKGVIPKIEPERVLQYSHFSPLSGKPDKPENYHIVTIDLTGNTDKTDVLFPRTKTSTKTRAKNPRRIGENV